ncbi:MAG: hypothetical protein F4Z15_12035 [Gammaproteobacteria bacterium]|nr:hypothetical protein [Gammaproteobacteria bacterium]
MSNRLTFSLASLILMFAFVAIPAIAHENIEGDTNFATHATEGHAHPVVTIVDPTDADPTSANTIEVVDTEADDNAAGFDETTRVATIQFDVMLTLPSTGLDTDVATGQIAAAEVTAYARTANDVPVGGGADGAVGVVAAADDDDATMVTLTITISETVTDDNDDDTTETQERAAGIAALIEAGLYVDLYVNAAAIQVTEVVPSAARHDQLNLQSRTLTVQVIAGEVTPAVPAMGEAATAKVSGSTAAVVTISATGTGTLPSGLTASDFSVTEMAGTTDLAPTVEFDSNELTITPDADATEDSVITVSTSTNGAKKITLSDVTVNVDRTVPTVTITPPTGDVVAGNAAMATVTISGADTGEAVELTDISVSQDANGSVMTLGHAYNTGTGAVTFTPTAASMVTVTVDADAVMDDVMNGNAETSIDITVVSPTAVMAAASEAKVNGSTNVVVTISATAPATVPTGLMASDFSVMEATAAGTALSPTVVGYSDDNMLTITPDATATDDTTITVSASTAGMSKIEFTDVTVDVDRTAPMVTITPPTGDVKAGQAAMATVTISGGDTGEAVAAGEITVTQTVTDSDPSVLGHEYDAATGMVTFTPTAESTVTVSVDAGAVMDDVMNGSAAVSIAITAGAADMVDSTGPMATVSGTQGTARAFEVTIVFDEALGATEELVADEITVTGGTIAGVAANADATMPTYTGMITPNHGVTAVTVQVNAGAVKDASPAMNANAATPATPHSITVRNTTAPTAAMIASKGYAVFVPMDHDASALPSGLVPHTVADMPDLSAHFIAGGTIDVAVTGGAKHNVIITEIMVARDLGRVGQSGAMRPEASQWIELYNNTDAAISVDDITITFTTGYPAAAAPANATDRFSNTVPPGWDFAATFADALSGQTAYNAATGVTTVTKMFKSLRRVHKDGKPLQNAGTVIQNGWDKGSWTLTADNRVFLAGRIGTAGSENRPTVFTPAVFTAPTMSVTFNEVANRMDDSNEWIELKGPKDTNLRHHKISIVTAYDKATNTGTETTIHAFPTDNDNVKIPAGDLLLLTDQDPVNNELAADLEKGVPKPVRYRVVTLAALPNDGNFLLVLRAKDGVIVDVAGHLAGLNDDDPYTTLWPLKANVGRISAKNKLAGGNVYKRARAIQGYSSNKDNGDEPAFEASGFSGIGYDRLVSANNKEHHGTPGYPNGAQIGAGDAATKNVIISEIMFGDGKVGFPQWIEIHNMSDTNGVNLHNWRLYIINHNLNADGSSFDGKLLDEVWLRNVKIPPNQTALIVTRSAPRHTTNLPSHRILNLRYDKPLLSSKGFSLKLEANSHEGDVNKRQAGDEVGNLAAADPNNRRKDHQAFMDTRWALPVGVNDTGARVSIARRPPAANGTKIGGWISSEDDPRGYGVATYYGRQSDVGSPGHTEGGVLPVSLSKFRPERLDDGSIVIRWITESELNNAGFNILRSEKRDGEFKQINTKLIAGQGTTSERTTYTHTDTSAKPNVVYYYQIQDVSLDGKVQTLRLSRLKGHISPAGKATTTWGELKALQ